MEKHKMLKNVAKNIKSIGRATLIMGIILAFATIFTGLVLTTLFEEFWIFLVSFPGAYIVYCIFRFSALMIYGYGELIETNQTIASNYTAKQNAQKEDDELPEL